MDILKLQSLLEKQFNENYYTPKELEYGNAAGVFLSPFEYKEFLEYKDSIASSDNPAVKSLPLPSFNYPHLYFSLGKDFSSLLDSYALLKDEDPDLLDRFSPSFTQSRIYSEIEGSLNVENVPTTRRRLKELLEENAPAQDKNDAIIKNMKAAIDFVHQLPEFNDDNRFKLYSLLSAGCLGEDEKLRLDEHYRYDGVEISHYHGCPAWRIQESMDALFLFAQDVLQGKDLTMRVLLPHICHYYLLYIHPYFDFNGRTARMVSYWIYLLSGIQGFAPIVSEAINQTKADYYRAIENSRDAHNDLTYFLKYLLSVSIDYFICYQNLRHLEQEGMKRGIILTETELNYVKRILISYHGPFTFGAFLKMANVAMSKQGALKLLNRFVDYGILKEMENPSRNKLFDVNGRAIPFSLKQFGYKNR